MILEQTLCSYPISTVQGTLLSNSPLVNRKTPPEPNAALPVPISKLGPETVSVEPQIALHKQEARKAMLKKQSQQVFKITSFCLQQT